MTYTEREMEALKERNRKIREALRQCLVVIHDVHESNYPYCTGGCDCDRATTAGVAALAEQEEG